MQGKFVNGKGKHKSQIRKDIEIRKGIYENSSKYTGYLEKTSNKRNSMSKIDTDAFMRMKEDYMRNGQLKSIYHIQIGVHSWNGFFIDKTDERMLIHLFEIMKSNRGREYTNVIAYAGYESEEKYIYLAENKQTSYIKPMNYEISKTRKYKTYLYRAENITYVKFKDVFVCSKGG